MKRNFSITPDTRYCIGETFILFVKMLKGRFHHFCLIPTDLIRPGPDQKPLYLDFSNLDKIILQRLYIHDNTVSDLWNPYSVCENAMKAYFAIFWDCGPH